MPSVDFEYVYNFIKSNSGRKFLITFHSIGDRDGVGAAIALSKYLTNSVVATPDYITSNAKHMLEHAGYSKEIRSVYPEDAEIIIVLDTNNFKSLGGFASTIINSGKQVLFIDHHLLSTGLERDAIIYSDENFNSTSSIVYELLKRLGLPIDKESAILLLNGIISDSADFQNATPQTFRQVADLLDTARMEYTDILSYFHEKVPLANRYSLINDIFASNAEIVGGYIIIYGRSNIHANIAADMALRLGADASLFWLINEKEVSISARLRPPLDRKLSLHLGKVMQDASEIIGGNGGGHPCAAGAYGPEKERAPDAIGKILGEIKYKFAEGR
ncbi:MAG: DHH family phosphoesterase [Candidatus Micrarchaeia archaeon]